MIKVLNNILENLLIVLNTINIIQQFFLFVLIFILFTYCLINSYTRVYLFKIFKKIIICLVFSLILNIFLNNDLVFCELSNSKKAVIFLSVGTISALAGITYWAYRNHDMLYRNYLSTIDENSIQIKYKFIEDFGTSYVEARGGINPEFYNLQKMPLHVLWAKSVGNIFSNIQKNNTNLSLKEWLAVSYGFSHLAEHYNTYLDNLLYLLEYRSTNPEIFNCAYHYYSNPDEQEILSSNPIFLAQEMESFRIANLLRDLDIQLVMFGGPTNLYYNRKIFSGQTELDPQERDLFFSSLAGIHFEKYIQIESGTNFTFNMFPSNPQNIINHSFTYIYPFLWVLEKTLGLPNPIPFDLVAANWQGTLNSFYFNNFPSAFKVTPQDLFDPYIFLDPSKCCYSFKSQSYAYVSESIQTFKSFCSRYIPKDLL